MARSTPGRKRKGGFRSRPTSEKSKQAVDTTELSAQEGVTKADDKLIELETENTATKTQTKSGTDSTINPIFTP
jgi:hypothetical protein